MLRSTTDLLGAEVVHLLEVEVGGQVMRFATEAVEIETAAGDTLVYLEGLGELELGTSFDGSSDAAIEVELDSDVAWSTVIAQHVRVERAPATIRRWVDGVLEDAEVLLTGRVAGLNYGEQGEPVSFAVVRQLRSSSREIPPIGATIDSTTWPSRAGTYETDEKVLGVPYPVVFGTPGNIGGEIVPATEAMLVEKDTAVLFPSSRLLIAGHRVVAATVTIFDTTDEGLIVSNSATVVHEQDAVGRWCALVDPEAAGFATVDHGRSWYVGWDGVAFSGGRPGGITGAGDLVEYLIRTFTSTRLDAGRFAAVRELLNAYRIDLAVVGARVTVDELLAEVLPLLPVEPRQGADGLWFRPRRVVASAADVVARLDADVGAVDRASPIRWESGDVVNEVTIEYAGERGSGRMLRRLTVGARGGGSPDALDPGLPGTDARVVGSYRARLSQQLFGEVLPLLISAPSVYDPATAARIARDAIEQRALPRRAVGYTGGPEYLALQEGDVVILNDSAVGLADVYAEVRDAVAGGPTVGIPLLLLDDPVMLERLAG